MDKDEMEEQLAALEIRMIGHPITRERKAKQSPITRTESFDDLDNFIKVLTKKVLNEIEFDNPSGTKVKKIMIGD
jgi:hypothetical protein